MQQLLLYSWSKALARVTTLSRLQTQPSANAKKKLPYSLQSGRHNWLQAMAMPQASVYKLFHNIPASAHISQCTNQHHTHLPPKIRNNIDWWIAREINDGSYNGHQSWGVNHRACCDWPWVIEVLCRRKSLVQESTRAGLEGSLLMHRNISQDLFWFIAS